MWDDLYESGFVRAAACCAVLGLLSWGIAGCGNTPPPPPPTPQEATAVMTSFLNVWKSGAKTADLATHNPPIRGIDYEWESNSRLLDYTIEDSGYSFGNSYTVRTQLKVQRPGSKQKLNLHIIYTVSTGDPISVVRE